MTVSKSFLRDFAYLADRYEWTSADVEEIKAAAVRIHPEIGRRYSAVLSTVHRDGYEQRPNHGTMRLGAWCLVRRTGVDRDDLERRPCGRRALHAGQSL